MPLVLLVALLLVTSCRAGPAPILPSDVASRNVIVIVIDCLRADHLGCYGYHRNTSPFIDKLAAGGIVFDAARANSSFTQESVGVLLTGLYPSRSGIAGWGSAPGEELTTIGELYAEAGYRTAFFSNSTAIRDERFAQGFEVAETLNEEWNTSGAGPRLSRRALAFVRENRDAQFMMYLHFLDPHGPYRPPEAFYTRFVDTVFPQPVNLYRDVRKRCDEMVADGFGPGEARFEDMVLRYDAEIAHVDSAVEELFEGLRACEVLDRTIIVITSDHGEEFLEHGFVEHAWTLYDEVLRVPLIVCTPGIRPARIETTVTLADLLPTLLVLSGIPHHTGQFDGRAVFRVGRGGFVFEDQSRPQIAETLIVDRNVLRSMTDGRWKYVAAWTWLTPRERSASLEEDTPAAPVDIWGPPLREELYDLERDPSEQHDLAAARPEVVARFRASMERFLVSCAATGRSPTRAADLSEGQVKELRALGYY